MKSWSRFSVLILGMLACLSMPSQSAESQEIGGTTLAGMQWETNRRVGNDWYNANFGAVVFDGDNDGHSEVWLLGGQSIGGPDDATSQNYSGAGSPYGFYWTPRIPAPWSNRSEFEAVVYHDKIWIFAGKETEVSDVWYAPKGLVGDPTSDSTMGLDWTRDADAPWPVRGGYEAEVFDGKIWLMGGYNGTEFLNDVWSFDGTTWQQEADAPWPGRDGFTSVAHNGELYIIGGRSNDGVSDYVLSDVWKTSDGISWTQVTANMNIGPIREHASVVFDNRIWIIGGNISTDDSLFHPMDRVSQTDEVWSSTDGAFWDVESAYGYAPFPRMQGHEVVVVEYYQNRKASEPHSQLQGFPRMLFTGGFLKGFVNGYVFVDRRDHEIVPYLSPTAESVTIESPKGRQASRTTSSSIEFSEDILISDLNIRLDMTHPQWSDITEMTLTLETTDEDGSPRTRQIPFMSNNFGNWGDGRFNSIITDEGGQPIGANTPDWYDYDPQPRFFAMRPWWSAWWYDGFTAKGTWTLEITDSVKGKDGELHGWSLEIRGMPLAASPGISVSPNQGLLTTEAGASDAFDVVLDSEPTADVTFLVYSDDTTEGTIDQDSLTFTAADWDIPQTVTVTGVDDPIEDGDIAYTIVTASATSNDAAYNGIDPEDVSVTNLDDEVPSGGSETYSSSDTPLTIPDNDSVASDILADDHLIANLTVNVNISHPRTGDLEVYLIDPAGGPPVQLFNYEGDNVVTDFNGTSSAGLWTLEVYDTKSGPGPANNPKTGTLNGWSITVDN